MPSVPRGYIKPSGSRPNEPIHATDPHDPPAPIPIGPRDYVEGLKMRLQLAEARLKEENAAESPGLQFIRKAIHESTGSITAPHSDDLAFAEIEASFLNLSIHRKGGFLGNSSRAMLLKGAIDMVRDTGQLTPRDAPPCRAIPDAIQSWKGHASPPMTAYSFPETGLLVSLVSSYFDNVNAFLPLLHRPAFEQDLRQHFHRSHSGFAKIVLLVCAVGARYTIDPRLPVPDTAGWEWFDQVNPCGHLVQVYASAFDIQAYCLAVQFLDATGNSRTCWNTVGFGIRAAQDLGLHRSNTDTGTATFSQELERRAFWVLLLFDTQIGTALGRGSGLASSEIDLREPVICDDKFWGTLDTPPRMRFRQPVDKPSVVAFFNCMIGVNRILALSCDILYSSNRQRLDMGLEVDGWQVRVVQELDSALNAWFETIPEHLRWDPDFQIQDDTFFDQSAALYCAYYHTRIVIHRPFIPGAQVAMNSTHLPSLAICNTAARACSHVADIQHRRRPNNPVWFSKTPLFTSGIVLLMNIWGGSGPRMARRKDLADVHRIITVISGQRRQWPSVVPLLETLHQLLSIDHPASPPTANLSRDSLTSREPEMPLHQTDIPPSNTLQQSAHALSPPMYDPELEIAPPVNYLDGYLAESQNADSDAGESTFKQKSEAAPSLNTIIDLPWAHAPAAFGVADWQVYLKNIAGSGGEPAPHR